MNQRRKFLALSAIGGMLSSAGANVFGQQSRVRKIGVLTSRPYTSDVWEAFKGGLRALGYVEGKNIVIEWRNAEGLSKRYFPLGEELVRAGVEVIVTHSNNAVIAVRQATTTVPIVAAAFGDPVSAGLATSLAHPGGNVTGISLVTDETAFKLIELARDAIPKIAHTAILGHAESPAHPRLMKDMEAVLDKAGIRTIPILARSPQDIEAGFATLVRERASVVIVLLDPFMATRRKQIAEISLRRKIAAFTQSDEFPEAGCLLSYGANLPAHFRQAAIFVDKILKGAKPGEIPIEQSTRFDLVVNLRTAKTLGITIPQSILVRVDRVIE